MNMKFKVIIRVWARSQWAGILGCTSAALHGKEADSDRDMKHKKNALLWCYVCASVVYVSV